MIKLLALLLIVSCAHKKVEIEKTDKSVKPGSSVTLGGDKVKLYNEGGVIKVNKPIASFIKPIADPKMFIGSVTVINIVPSIDTKVCEEQTHILGETDKLYKTIKRVSISRDLPMAQSRFAKEAKLENIVYLSDFKDSSFGKNSGLLMTDKGLLARGVIITDKQGIIRYIQVVPEVAMLPDMDKAMKFANDLL
jgi:thiol peroxidase